MTDETVPVDTGTGGEAPVAPTAPVTTDNTPITTPADVTPTEFTPPEEYKDKGWAKNIKSVEDLWKNNDNAQGLIGKKTIGGVEDWDNAEQRTEFFNKMTPEKYEVEGLQESNADAYNDVFKESGLSNWQAQNLVTKVNEMQNAELETLMSKDGFDTVMKESFNGDTEAQSGAKALLDKNTNEADQTILSTLTNEQAGAMYRMANSFSKTHGVSEGQAINSEASSQTGGGDVKATRAQIYKEMTALAGKPHGAEQKQALQARLDATYTGGK